MGEQRQQLEQTEQLYIERSARLREMRDAAAQDGEGSAEAMLKMLRNEVGKARDATARVRREHEEKLQRLKETDAALSEPPVTQGDINNLEEDIGNMLNECESLEKTIAEANQDSRLSVYKQQANLVAKKKEGVLKEKRQLEEELHALGAELSKQEREYEQMKGHKFMKRDEFKNYAASLRDKSAKFKRLKAELSDLRHEVSVLVRTEQLLQAKDPTPHGLREAEAALEKASVEKSAVDKAKGKTLDEISAIVQKITQQLKEKKNKLAPQIRALREKRKEMQLVDATYMEKKAAYDQVKGNIDADITRLSNEVRQLESEVNDSERSYHELHMSLAVSDTRLQRAHRETRCVRKEERYSRDFATLAECYSAEISHLDRQCHDLRKQQKVIKDGHEGNLKQKKAFVQLEALMKVKLKVAKQEMQSMQENRAMNMYGTRAVMDGSTAGVERLVIE